MAKGRGVSLLTIFGVLSLLVAFVLGLAPISVATTDYNSDTETLYVTGEVSCGSAAMAKPTKDLSDVSAEFDCRAYRGIRLQLVSVFLLAALLLIPLGLAGIGGTTAKSWEIRRVAQSDSIPTSPVS
jgi:hypothetical protein